MAQTTPPLRTACKTCFSHAFLRVSCPDDYRAIKIEYYFSSLGSSGSTLSSWICSKAISTGTPSGSEAGRVSPAVAFFFLRQLRHKPGKRLALVCQHDDLNSLIGQLRTWRNRLFPNGLLLHGVLFRIRSVRREHSSSGIVRGSATRICPQGVLF